MRYIINFQIKITCDDNKNKIIRSSYTILEKEVRDNDLSSIKKVENWFKELFNEKPLDYFIDTSKLGVTLSLDMKIGRITNSISGKYKTF